MGTDASGVLLQFLDTEVQWRHEGLPELTAVTPVQVTHQPEQYINLIASVIRSGLKAEGPGYLTTPGGRYWCGVANLNVEAIWRRAVRHGRERHGSAEFADCAILDRDTWSN